MPTATHRTVNSLPVLGRDIVQDERMMTIEQAQTLGAPAFVDPEKSYHLVIQLGADASWRKYKGGRWCVDESNAPEQREGAPKRHTLKHVARVHECEEAYSGKVVNGLIALHAKFLRNSDNPQLERQSEAGGFETYTNPQAVVSRQLLVLNIEECDAPPVDNPQLAKERRERQLLASLDRIAAALEGE